jgi:hypothetical protein
VTPREQLLAELAATVRGPRHARRRLLEEIREDLRDAVQAELDDGLDPAAAEDVVVDRFGDASAIAMRWNRDHAERRGALRRNVVLVLAAAVTASALGITQHASGTNPPSRVRDCANVSRDVSCPHDRARTQLQGRR